MDGTLHRAAPGDGLTEDGSTLARQGWQALREVLEDLSDQRDRISNTMPQLGRALARLEAALGTDYDAMNPVAVGTHGSRVIRQAGLAGNVLMDEDAADIQEFAAALALYLERFVEWRDYRDAAQANPLSAEDALEGARAIAELNAVFNEASAIHAAIPTDLETQIADVHDAPDDPIASTGLLASTSNVLAGILGPLVPFWKACRDELKDVTAQTWAKMKTGIAATLAGTLGSLGMLGLDLLFTKGATFTALAAKYPGYLGWLQKLLTGFGLL